MLGASLAGARDIAVVSNKSNAVSAIAIPDLIKLCKAQTAHWPDGKPVTFVMRLPTSPEMKMVLDKVYGMSQSEVTTLIVSANHGRTNHPAIMVVATDEDLVNQVASTRGRLEWWTSTPSTAVWLWSKLAANFHWNPATCCTAISKVGRDRRFRH